jgi:penicillin-binding protein 1C
MKGKEPHPNGRSGIGRRRTVRASLIALAVFLFAVLLLFSGAFFPAPRTLPAFRAVREAYRPSEGYLLDRHGEILQQVRADFRGRRLPWVSLPEISPSLVAAVLRSEDKRFHRHPGVDGIALLSAVGGNLLPGKGRGASTITMQLVSLLDGGRKVRGTRERILAKIRQARMALLLERFWTKEEILEAYLNRITFRGELQGIAAASRGIFDKEPGGLDAAESVVLASLIRSPNASPGLVARRATHLSSALGWGVPAAATEALARDRLQAAFLAGFRHDLAPHAARILSPAPGERIASTLDASLQKFAMESLGQQLGSLSGQNVRDGSVLVVENATGDILAYVGSAGDASPSPFVDGIRARRQAGSTLKPFLYGLAIEKRVLTSASLLDDSPLDVSTERGLYVPKNYDREFRGLVTVRTALASSLNVPAVRTLLLLGSDEMARRLAAFGFDLPGAGEEYGASLALGSADVTLFDLVNAYRTLANGGRWSPMRLSPMERSGVNRRAMTRDAAFIVSDILFDRGARGTTFGLASPLSTPFWTAVKTGTSKDMRDNWCVGFSDRYTVGVWVGNFSGEPMWNVSGVSGAAPVWMEIMLHLHGNHPGRAPAPPSGVVAQSVGLPDEADIERKEWFLKGTEPVSRVMASPKEQLPKIRYPMDGTIVAMDPDIPPDRQVVFFEAGDSVEGYDWDLDGKRVPGEGAALPWHPESGNHILSLVGRDGRPLETVRFTVRGNSFP